MAKRITLARFSRELAERRPYELVLDSEKQPEYSAVDPLVAELRIKSIRVWALSGIIEMFSGDGKLTLHRVKGVDIAEDKRDGGRIVDIYCAAGVGDCNYRRIRLNEIVQKNN